MPRTRFPKHLIACLGAMLFISCSEPMGLCGCSEPAPSAVLHGRVTDAAGAPVQGARVVAEHAESGCTALLSSMGEAVTEADGSFSTYVGVVVRTPRAGDCLRAFALPPAGSTLRGSDTATFSARFSQALPLDSVRMDLVLRAP